VAPPIPSSHDNAATIETGRTKLNQEAGVDLCIPVAVSMVLSFFWLPLPLPRRHHLYLSLPLSTSLSLSLSASPSSTIAYSTQRTHAACQICDRQHMQRKVFPKPRPKGGVSGSKILKEKQQTTGRRPNHHRERFEVRGRGVGAWG
jgi:hypothetical protein